MKGVKGSYIKKSLVRLDLGSYWLWAVLRVLLTLAPQSGYVHPDEFFQSVEVFAGNVFKTDVFVPWEFNPKFPLRSIPIMYIVTSIPLSFLRWLSLIFGRSLLSPYLILVIPRLCICALSFISDYCLYRVCFLYGQNFRRRLVIFASSYVTLIYATRTFSNTVEMLLFNILICLVAECMAESEKINYQDDFLKEEYRDAETTADRVRIWKIMKMLPSHSTKLCLPIAVVCVAGVFNRATFVTYAIPPVFYWLQRGVRRHGSLLHFHARFLLLILYSIPTTLVFIFLDSAYYGYITWGEIINKDIGFHSFVVTPLNFVRYNVVTENVANHGLHPRWLHALVNLPLMFNLLAVAGVLVMVNMVYRGSQMYWSMLPRPQSITSMLTLSTVVPVAVLSLIPHQEPRFLAPLLLPLVFLYSHLITRFDEDCPAPALTRRPKQKQLPFLEHFDNRPNIMGRVLTFINTQAVAGKPTKRPGQGRYELIGLWYLLNLLLAAFYGFVHQGGVYALTKSFRARLESQPKYTVSHLLYSHTYLVPQHLLMRETPPLGVKQVFTVTQLPDDISKAVDKISHVIKTAEALKKVKKRSYRVFYALPAPCLLEFDIIFAKRLPHLSYTIEEFIVPHLATEALALPSVLSIEQILSNFQLLVVEIRDISKKTDE